MKIATWNISSGVNTANYQGELFDKQIEASAEDECLNQIAAEIKKHNIDVIALQEVITTKSFAFMETLSKLSGLEYFETFENSPGFLVKDSMFGVAVLSKYPIEVIKKEFFTNPNLTKKTEKGVYTTHDKAFMCVKVKAEEDINVITTQFLPFHRFNADILEYKHIFDDFQDYISSNNIYVCGDFNVTEGNTKLALLLDKLLKTHKTTFDAITTTDGKRCDNVLIPQSTEVKSVYMESEITPSDHYLLVVEI